MIFRDFFVEQTNMVLGADFQFLMICLLFENPMRHSIFYANHGRLPAVFIKKCNVCLPLNTIILIF